MFQQRLSSRGTDFYHKSGLGLIQELRQRQIESLMRPRSRLHRRTKTISARSCAMDRYDKHVLPARRIPHIRMLALRQNTILNSHRREVTRTRAKHRNAPARKWFGCHQRSDVGTPNLKKSFHGDVKNLFPRMRTDGVREKRGMLSLFQTITTRCLHIFKPAWQFRSVRQRVDDNRAIARMRTEHAISLGHERLEQSFKAVCPDDHRRRRGKRSACGDWRRICAGCDGRRRLREHWAEIIGYLGPECKGYALASWVRRDHGTTNTAPDMFKPWCCTQ